MSAGYLLPKVRRWPTPLCVIVSVVLACGAALSLEPSEAAERGLRSTVQVTVADSLGSGFAVHPRLIVTNAHVVGDAKSATVTTGTDTPRRTATCTVTVRDVDWDLALLLCPKEIVPALPLSSTDPRLGMRVIVIGNPAGLQGVTTFGAVSKVTGPFIFTDAAVNPGNSGGPLVDMDGRVLGVVTLKGRDLEGVGIAQSAALLPMLWQDKPLLAEMVRSAQSEAELQRFIPVAADRYTRVNPSWAETVCGFDANDHFSCKLAELRQAEMVVLQSKTAHTSLDTSFKAIVDPAWSCIRGVQVSLAHPSKQIRVDWSSASFAVNGIAAQAAPAFSGDAVKSLSQRPSVAAPGVRLVQDVVSLDRQCLLPAGTNSQTDTVRLILPVQTGGTGSPTLVEWNLFRQWKAANPARVARLTSPPTVLPDTPWPVAPTKPDLTPPEDIDPTPYMLYFSVGAVGVGAATLVLAVGALALTAVIGTPAVFLGCGVVAFGAITTAALAAAGYLLDNFEDERIAALADDYDTAMSYYQSDMEAFSVHHLNRRTYEETRLRSVNRRRAYDAYIQSHLDVDQAY